MKLLLLDSEFIEYEPKKKAIASAEKVPKQLTRVDNCLVVFVSVEKEDEKDISAIAVKAVEEIDGVAKQIAQKKIVVYPWVHLSHNPSSPGPALTCVKQIEELLNLGGKYEEIHRVPFGWYKSFNIKDKGHPLAELSREIYVDKNAKSETKEDEHTSKAVKKEAELKSQWYIMTPDGKMIDVSKFNFSGHHALKAFSDYEISGTRETRGKDPLHIPLMRKMQLVDFEPGSDPGNLRWYPNGELIKNLMEDHITNVLTDYGAMKVETPIMYDFHHPALEKYLNRFPARQYTIMSDKKELFLRFSACFGQYLIKHDASISYKNLPLKMYELTHYSFRREKSGELSGLRRLRGFTMPDMHTLCKDIESAKQEFSQQFDLCMDWMKDVDVPYVAGFRFVKSFFDENKEYITDIVKRLDKPVLIELWDKQFFYFVMKFEFNFVDSTGKAAALSTVQIDTENTERFGIKYTDTDNKRKFPLMLHASVSGGIDRNLYAILEHAGLKHEQDKINPLFPLWLSPTQVRLAPVNDTFIKDCEKIAKQLVEAGIRADVDDRSDTVGKKIRDAEIDWIPFIVVYGEKEKSSGKLAVRFRENGQVKQLSGDELIKLIKQETKGYPFRKSTMNMLLSKRPVFVG
ncbi:threonine--tRNA ligase [archaeon]|nr:threonine--tRNA ligase [archaeon]